MRWVLNSHLNNGRERISARENSSGQGEKFTLTLEPSLFEITSKHQQQTLRGELRMRPGAENLCPKFAHSAPLQQL